MTQHVFIYVNEHLLLFGPNSYHQLGNIKLEQKITNIQKIFSGSFNTFILKDDGQVFCSGDNREMQIGLPSKIIYKDFRFLMNDVKFIAISFSNSYIYDNSHCLYEFGNNTRHISLQLININKIVCGDDHVLMFNDSHQLYGKGSNLHGQLGLGKNVKSRKKFTLLLKNSKIKNIYAKSFYSLIEKFQAFSIQICLTGTLIYTQYTLKNIPVPEENTSYIFKNLDTFNFLKYDDIKFISCGSNHIFFFLKNFDLYCMGENYHNQLGIRNISFCPSPFFIRNDPNISTIFSGYDFTLIYHIDGTLLIFGRLNQIKSKQIKLHIPNIKLINDQHIFHHWSFQTHQYFDKHIRNIIFISLYFFKKIKLPQFVIQIIFNYFVNSHHTSSYNQQNILHHLKSINNKFNHCFK